MNLSPLARAIFRGSLVDLEHCISQTPDSVLEPDLGLTCLEMCRYWPEGLQRLLKTKAKSLMNDYTVLSQFDQHGTRGYPSLFIMMIVEDHVALVEDLMNRDYILDVEIRGARILSRECARLVASNLAQRRRKLLSLAQGELGILQDLGPSDLGDSQAASICKALDDASIYVPQALRVSEHYTSIYACQLITASYFDVFYEHGFHDLISRDPLVGLTPLMKRPDWIGTVWDDLLPQEMLQQEWLDQHPTDPSGLGLNTHATGWHYIANDLGKGSDFDDDLPERTWMVLSQCNSTDECVCWCSAESGGCSPRKSFWKAYIDDAARILTGFPELHPTCTRRLRRSPFRFNAINQLEIALDFVRLLTFEIVGMTHTCCFQELITKDGKGRQIAGINRYGVKVLLNCDPRHVRETRSRKTEQQNAVLLNTLMEEFSIEIRKAGSSLEALEAFLWGYWRSRISKLFIVDPEAVSNMQRLVDNVETRRFLLSDKPTF